MAEVLDFLRFGSSPEPIKALDSSVTAHFLPALALAASDDPSCKLFVLSSLAHHTNLPKAFSYAALDYRQIRRQVLEAEVQAAAVLPQKAGDEESVYELRELEESLPADECALFEEANENGRAVLTLLSLRKRSADFSVKFFSIRPCVGYENGDKGSIWNNEGYLHEMLCILPIVVSRCPMLLTAEQLIKGLLTTRSAYPLMVAALANNPTLCQPGILFLTQMLGKHIEVLCDKQNGVSLEPAKAKGTTNAPLHKTHQHQQGVLQHPLKLNSNITSSKFVETAARIIHRLSLLAPYFALTCRNALIDACILPEMAIMLTVELIHDELEFLSRALFLDQSTSQWLLAYMGSNYQSYVCLSELSESTGQTQHKRKIIIDSKQHNDKEWLIQQLRVALLEDAQSKMRESGWCAELHAHLRIYCILVRGADLTPSPTEVDFWLKALSHHNRKPRKGGSERTLQLGIAFLCLVPGLSGPSTRAQFHSCIMQLLSTSMCVEPIIFTREIELAVWVAVQLYLRHFSDIAELVRKALGMHVTVHNVLMRDLAEASIACGLISEPSVIANAVAALRPQGAVTSKVAHESLTLRSLEHLLSAGVFARCAVDISDIVMHCIMIAKEPVNQALVQVIPSFTELLVPGRTFQTSRMRSLPREYLESVISAALDYSALSANQTSHFKSQKKQYIIGKEKNMKSLAPSMLCAYYVLCKEQSLRNVGLGGDFSSFDMLNVPEEEHWWSHLLTSIPWYSLFLYMEANWEAYENLLPQWLGLAASLFPEKFHVPRMLESIENHNDVLDTAFNNIAKVEDLEWVSPPSDDNLDKSKSLLSSKLIKAACKEALEEPIIMLHIIKLMAKTQHWRVDIGAQVSWDKEYALIEGLVPVLLKQSCIRHLQEEFCSWWHNMPAFAGEQLTPFLFENLKDSGDPEEGNIKQEFGVLFNELWKRGKYDELKLTYRVLISDPLLVLRCTPHLFRSPLLSVVLDVLVEILTINRRICQGASSDAGKDNTLKREEVLSALAVQDSAICQVLLEVCVPNRLLGDHVEPGPLNEAQGLIFAAISSLFHANPSLIKLLHFQGYDMELIPKMVEAIPMMSQCLDFIEELLQQKKQEQKIFAVILSAQIVRIHRELPQAYSLAEKVVAHVHGMHDEVSGTSELMHGVLKALSEIAIMFPSLSFEVVNLLQSCAESSKAINGSRQPRDPSLYVTAVDAFQKFIESRVLYGQVPATFKLPDPASFA